MIDKSTFQWPKGRQGAVSITYDDALICHHQLVAPAWEAVGLRANPLDLYAGDRSLARRDARCPMGR